MTLLPKVGLGCLLLALFLAPLVAGFPVGATYGHDDALNAVRLLAFVALALSPVRERTVRGGKDIKMPSVWLALAAVWGLLSLLARSKFLTSPTLLFAMLPATLDGILFAALVFAVGRFEEKERGLIVRALLLCATVVSGLCVFEALTGAAGTRAQGTFFSPNFAAGFLGLSASLALIGLLSDEKPALRIAHGALAALCLAGVAATGSRSALVLSVGGAILTTLLAGWAQRGKLPWLRVLAAHGAGIALALLVGFGVGARPLSARAAGAGQEQSGAFRTWTWKGTLTMAKAEPLLGHGPGTFPYRYPVYAQVGTTGLAHSSYLELAAERGAPALLFTLAGLGLAAFAALKRLRTDLSAAGLLGALAVGAARSVFDSEWALIGNALPFFAVVGLCESGHHRLDSDRASGRGGLWLLLPALLCLPPLRATWPPTAESAPTPEARFTIEPSLRVAIPAGQRATSPEERTRWLERARVIDPTNLQLLKFLAEAYEAVDESAKAQAVWEELAAKSEGPIGTIRAIPEVTDTNPAWAYAALGRWERVAEIVERYSNTAPLYQRQELALAARPEIVAERREKLKSLYLRAAEALALPADRRDATMARIDTMSRGSER
jgi:O-antigen ligase